MKRSYGIALILSFAVAAILWHQLGRGEGMTRLSPSAFALTVGMNEPIQPIESDTRLDQGKVKLGKALFHETRLSHDNSLSCASCHGLDTGGVDQRRTSLGINGADGAINAPTVLNSGANFKQFWDGRAETLEDQIDGPIHAADEMGSNWPEVIAKLKGSPEYLSSFDDLYSDGIQVNNIKDAIATFERSLNTPGARFDRYLRGDTSALNDEEKQGYQVFKSYGCISCHQGRNVGGNMFQTFGVMADYFADRGKITKADLGRFNITGDERDRYVFKVPGLRNVELTAPYFHDGSVAKLESAVEVMGRYQLGRNLSPREIDLIVKFLKTLTAKHRTD
jgi:cytochrome c peroxidase